MSATTDFAGMIGPVARELLGEPNPRLSKERELRYGSNGSLSVDLDKDTWYSHESEVGGGVIDLVRAYGSDQPSDWLRANGFLRDDAPVPAQSPSAAATYDYVDEHGEILFQVVRKAGHDFRQRRPDGAGGWEWTVKGVRQVPYRLPEVLTASPDELVFVAEGEKDVDNVRALGLVATCNAGGAGKWRATHAEFLRGRDVVILPDNDDSGRKHAESVAQSLDGIARSVRVLELPGLPVKGDVSDWIAAGGTREALLGMLPPIEPKEGPLRQVSLAGVMHADETPIAHVVKHYFPRRLTTLLGGHGGVGKSMLALILAAHVAAGRGWYQLDVEQDRVVFLSFEDEGDIVLRRLRRIIEAYRLPADAVTANLAVFDGTDSETELALESQDGTGLDFTPMMIEVAEAVRGAGLVFIDNASDTYGANENARRQVRKFLRRLTVEAKANNAAVVLLAHIDKAAARGGGKGQSFSGSTQWHNSVRSRLALVESEEFGLQLLHEKANHSQPLDPISLRRGQYGVLEPVAPEAAAAARSAAEADRAKSDSAVVLSVMEALLAGGVQIPTAETGQRTAYHVLCRAAEMPECYRTAAGKERVKAAIQALERAARISRERYRKPDRKPGERWTLPHFPAEGAG
jgi:RecA-family ATPase